MRTKFSLDSKTFGPTLTGLRPVTHQTPFPVEAKHRKRWEIPEWVRRIRVAAGGDNQWALVVASGDRRKSDSATLMIVDWDFGQQLLEAWDEWS